MSKWSSGRTRTSYYTEYAIRLQSTDALTGAGSVALAWNPDNETLTVHKVQIRRGEAVIDVLAKQRFTVLRRETNLQRAQLDGELTATLQVEGLQVGDVLDVAFTRRGGDPAMKGRSNLILGWPSGAVDRAVIRGVWSGPKQIQWRATGGLEMPVVTRRGTTTEVVLDRLNVQPAHLPKDAPARFRDGPQLEFSDFRSWAEAGALMRPLYDQASALKPDSPLKAEVAKIRATSSDPKARAAAALALVQGQVRYLFLGMNDGGYVPADADQTWSRRFGDCKGKTALLLALLRELGIEAEPAFVSTTNGDGLDARLPTLGLFDHVLVRTVLGGKTYWLDGARTDDRDLDDLRTPDWRWSLPERAAGATLVKLEPAPLAQPDELTTVRIDASGGLDAPATVRAETLLRGDGAREMQTTLSSITPAQRDKVLREAWQKSFPHLTIGSTSSAMDDKTGEFRMVVNGKAPLEWKPPANTNFRFLKLPDAELGWSPDYDREPGPLAGAPFEAHCGTYTEFVESIILPRGGVGFTAPAPDVDEKVAGCALHRRSRIEKGVFTVERSVRGLAPEFPASEAPAAAKTLKALAETAVYVRTPPTFVPTTADLAALAAAEPTTATGYIDRGNSYTESLQYDKAIADFNKAIALDPKDSYGFSNRGIAHYWKHEEELAKADFEAAAKLNGRDVVAVHGQGLLAWRAYRYREAIAAFSRAIDLKADNTFALRSRSSLYSATGDYDAAVADLDEMLRINPGVESIHLRKSQILLSKGDMKGAVAEAEAAMKNSPGDLFAQLTHASLRAEQGQTAEAMSEFAATIAAHPAVDAYLTRAKYRPKTDRAGRQADIEAALKLDPNSITALDMQAEWRGQGGAHAQAIATLTQALKAKPDESGLLFSRARAFARAGDLKSAERDLADAARKVPNDPSRLNALCWTRATYGLDLQQALADCDHSLAINPASPQTLDSRAFVLLRLGRLEEAVTAYDAALKMRPGLSASLYGRGVAKLRLQRTKEGEADMAAGKAVSAKIADDFAEWGVPAPAKPT